MSSTTIYNNALLEMVRGTLNFTNGANSTYKVMLLGPTSTYVVNKSHTNISDVTSNGGVEASGTGYTAGGKAPANITSAVVANAVELSFDDVSWTNATLNAKAAILYNPTTSRLVAYIDFGTTVTASNSTFTVDFQTPLKLQN